MHVPTMGDSSAELETLRTYCGHLLEFITMLCAWDIKTPTGRIEYLTDLMRRYPKVYESGFGLETIQRNSEDILDMLNTVLLLAAYEREPAALVQEQRLTDIDLLAMLRRHLRSVEQHIAMTNTLRADDTDVSTSSVYHTVMSTRLEIDLPDTIPPVVGYTQLMETVVRLLTRIAVKQPLTSVVTIAIEEIAAQVRLAVSWRTDAPNSYLLEQYDQFAQAQTGFAFSGHAVALYVCRQLVLYQGGAFTFTLEADSTHVMRCTFACSHARDTYQQDVA